MKKNKPKKNILNKLTTALVLSLGAALFLSACASESSEQTAETLRIGVYSDVVNMSSLSEATGNYYGLEVDIAKEMASRMGYGYEFVTVETDTREDYIEEDKVECVIACFSISEFREETLDFSESYYTDSISILVEDSALYTDISDLMGKTIGVKHGSNSAVEFAKCMAELGYIPEFDTTQNFNSEDFEEYFHIEKLDNIAELEEKLESGEIDAICADGCIVKGCMNGERMEIDGLFEAQDYGVATAKGSDLSEGINDAIVSMKEDGTIADLIDKWDLDDDEE